MPKNINLVPEGTIPKSTTLNVVNNLRILDAIGTLIFFVGVFVITSIIIINSQVLRISNSNQEKLKASIKNMQKEEQQYVLVKDRIEKIQSLAATKGILTDIENFASLKNSLPQDILINEVEIAKGKTEASIVVGTYASLAQTLADLVSLGLYKEVILNSFSFSPDAGYLIAVRLSS